MLLEEPKVQALAKIKDSLPKGSTVLDVGFGRGEVLLELAKAGYRVIGTEISSKMTATAARRLPSARLYIADDPSKVRELVDCTVCFEVLEHLKKPETLLDRLPKGLTYFSTPNANRWWAKLSGRYEPWDYSPNHLQRFTAESLKELLESNSYESVEVYELPVVGGSVFLLQVLWLFDLTS